MRHFWEVVEPETDLEWNWHIEAVTRHLEAVTRQQTWKPGTPEPEKGRIPYLVINIPPGTMKSLLVSVFWPAWEWIDHPHLRSLFGSKALDLAIRDSVRCRDVLTSEKYREWFEPQWELKGDQNVKSRFNNTCGGVRQCVSVGATITGFRGDKVVMDDPQDANEAHSDTIREAANTYWDRGFSTRLNDRRRGAKVVIQQRLHTNDTTGHLTRKGLDIDHLILPAEFDSALVSKSRIGFVDPRTQPGELLFPGFLSREVLAEAKAELGPIDYAGQYGQKPAPADGAIFRKEWIRFWKPANTDLPPVRLEVSDGNFVTASVIDLPAKFDLVAVSCDMAFKDKPDNDNVAGQVWGRVGTSCFLLDQDLGKKSFTASIAMVRRLVAAYPQTSAVLIEDKANGSAAIDTLKGEIPGVIPIEPDGPKVGRAHATTPYFAAGNVLLPHPAICPWVWTLIHSLTTFPNGAHDDDVDALTQAVRWLLSAIQDFVYAEDPGPIATDAAPLPGFDPHRLPWQ